MPRHRRKTKGGAASWSEWFQQNNPLASKPAVAPVIPQTPPPPPPATLPQPLAAAVQDSQEMVQTAGRRIQKHTGYNPASSKSMRKLFGTAKGDKMLGRKHRRRTHRR